MMVSAAGLEGTTGSSLGTTDEHAKALSYELENMDNLLEVEHNLTFRAVWSRYPKIVGWSFFWCMTAVACAFVTLILIFFDCHSLML